MVEAFILYAFNKKEEFSVPIARVLIASSDLEFFHRHEVVGKTKGEWFMEFVLKWVRKECPCVLAPFSGEDWDFYLNTEDVAYFFGGGEELDYLPVIDLTSAPVGVII
jgi:hypothetical protein